MDAKIYTEMRMLVGTAIGGPFASAYYLVRTLRTLEKSNIAVALAVIFPLLILAFSVVAALVPELDKLPDPFWYLLQFGVLLGFVRGYMLVDFQAHINALKPVYGWGNTLLVSFLSLIVTLAVFSPFYLQYFGFFDPMISFKYGKLNHEIYYDPANVTEPEVRRIAASLTETEFATDEFVTVVEATRSGQTYTITIFFPTNVKRSELSDSYKRLRDEIQRDFPVERIVLELLDANSRQPIARLE